MLTKTAQRIAEEYGHDFILQQDLIVKNLLTKYVKNKEKIDKSNLLNARKQFKERSHTWYCMNCLYVYKGRYAIDEKSICKNCSKKSLIKMYQYELENLVYPLYRFGVEFEGVWTRNPHYNKTNCSKYYHLDQKGDGSVKGFGSVDNLYHIGEMTTEPIRFTTKGLELFRYIIQRGYPNLTNKFCGGHVHFSLSNNKMVEVLLTKDFYDGVFGGLTNHVEKNCTKIGQNEFFERIEENSSYCKDVFDPENSIIRNSDRYFRMNLHPWSTRHTVEFRILPQFKKPEDYYSCIVYMLNYTDNYLRDHLWIGDGNSKTNILVPDYTQKTRTVNYKLVKPVMRLEEEMLVENVDEDMIEPHTNLDVWDSDVELQNSQMTRLQEQLNERLRRDAMIEATNHSDIRTTTEESTVNGDSWGNYGRLHNWGSEDEQDESEREEDD